MAAARILHIVTLDEIALRRRICPITAYSPMGPPHLFLITELAGARDRIANDHQRGLPQRERIRLICPAISAHVLGERRM